MQMKTKRRSYSFNYYIEKCASTSETREALLFLLVVVSFGTLFVLFTVVTFVYNLPRKITEPMCLFSGQDDLVNGGKIEGTALTCKLCKDSAGCNHYEETPTLEQEIEETLQKLNEIKRIL
jgi:hypothetical protein